MDGEHVREDRRYLLLADIPTRVSAIQQDVWLDYQPSEKIFRIINNMEKIPRRQTAPALLVVGEGGTGKSSIISQFKRRVTNNNGLICWR